ncbi:hypothetical protein B0T14DRAFT_240178 [Immersiella caudata]|uniref:Uncharacterized protein n=1 Tax=Immersiella caudata TaxID=314043 RepID=A0AA39WTC7_9PEZI|nr:hypothetical protein B0T14DRAFT_240178 [Immersiella caudata]
MGGQGRDGQAPQGTTQIPTKSECASPTDETRLPRRRRRSLMRMTRPSSRRREPAKKELAAKAGGKGPLNTGAQGIKKSGKK